MKKIIFSCDGRRLCFEEEKNYYRQSGHNGKLDYLDDQLARLSNDSERQEALETARKHYPASTEILEAIAVAYPEPIYCPYYIKGMIWPFFND